MTSKTPPTRNCPECNAVITLPIRAQSAWEKSSFIAWISLVVTVIVLAIAFGRTFERLSTTIATINEAEKVEKDNIQLLHAELTAHELESARHFSERDAADFQTMKTQISAIGIEQGSIVRTLSSIDRRLRFNK